MNEIKRHNPLAHLKNKEFNKLRNALATKGRDNVEFDSFEEVQTLINAINLQIEKDGGPVTLKDIKGDTLQKFCGHFVR